MMDTLEARLRTILDGKAKPVGSLGRLEDLAVRLGMIQRTTAPIVRNPAVAVFAADHGAVRSGVSAYPSAVTEAMVRAYLGGHAAISLFAAQAGARLVVVDAGVDASLPPHPGLIDAKMRRGTDDWTQGPAMTPAEAEEALRRGASVVDHLVADGANVLALGEMGIGNTASAALLAHKVAELDLVVGPGAGLDPPGVAHKRHLVSHAAARTPARLGPIEALSAFGGFEIAMLAGAVLRAADQRVCVLVDGLIVTSAVLLAQAIRADSLACCVFAHGSAEPGHAAMLAHLGATPLLDLGLRLGEGTGAALAIPLLRAAASVLTGMADLRDLV